MFAWHEKTLRGWCRLAVVLLVAVPTLAVLLAVVWCRSPLSLEYHRRALAEWLALDVRLERVSFPLPGVTIYEGLSLADPESGGQLARLRALECQTAGDKTVLVASQAEMLDVGRFDLVAELVNRRIRQGAGTSAVVEIVAPQLTLYRADGQALQTLSEVRCQLQACETEAQAGQPQGSIEFHLAGDEQDPQAKPARVSIERNRAAGRSITLITLETGPTALPATLVELVCPGWEAWGRTSNFAGRISWQQRADGWSGEVSGRISGVDLDRLASQYSKHQLSGLAEIQLDSVRVEQGRLVTASGSIHAGPGLIGRGLLNDAANQLHASGDNPSAPQGDLAAYDELALRFTINDEGLRVEGVCDDPPGTLMVGHDRTPLLGQPPAGAQSLLGLVRLLASSGVAVPADRPAQALLSVLPVHPESAAEQPVPPHVRRLRAHPFR